MIQLVTYSRARHCAEPFLFIEFVHAHAIAKNNITNSVMHPLLTVNDMSTEGHQHRIPPTFTIGLRQNTHNFILHFTVI